MHPKVLETKTKHCKRINKDLVTRCLSSKIATNCALKCLWGPLILLNSELSQISRTTRQKVMKICKNLKEGNNNHHERFHTKRANISARYND